MEITIAFLIALACMIGGIFLWFKFYNSEDAERYMRQRMQGPFVPDPRSEDVEDIATHQARTSEKSVDFADVAESLKQRGKI
jgi:hypothetical protein